MSNQTVEDDRLSWAACKGEHHWYILLAASAACFFGGLFLILAYRLLFRLSAWIKDRRKQHNGQNDTSSELVTEQFRSEHRTHCCYTVYEAVHVFSSYVTSFQNSVGRALITLSMVIGLCSFAIYVIEATLWPGEVEKCGVHRSILPFIDFVLNIYLLFNFIVRFLAAEDTLQFWVDGFSIVDYLTVPPILISFMLGRTWLGFRFVRVFVLTDLPNILLNYNIIKSGSRLHLCRFITIFLSIFFSGAGMFLLLENSGNLFSDEIYQVDETISYPSALYFTMVTMSTVGYGDISPKTVLGRIFIIVFIMIALATFAGAIPVIEESFLRSRKYHGNYLKPEGISHIVVCGDINTSSVKTFLGNFLHEDRKRTDVDVVFLDPSAPDLQLQSILGLHFSRVKYFRGTVMDQTDLQRVRIDEADACLVLASSTANDPDAKDAGNIMRVIAVKNYAPHVRVIVQLLQSQNKVHLLNSPYWKLEYGDEILCFSELKLGFLAQSCIAPGFSTLLINLISMQSESDLGRAEKMHKAFLSRRSRGSQKRFNQKGHKSAQRNRFTACISGRELREKSASQELDTAPWPQAGEAQKRRVSDSKRVEDRNWYHDYLFGMNTEIYSARFSSSFEGMYFSEAAVICRQRLDLLLIAILASVPRGNKGNGQLSEDSDSDDSRDTSDDEESGHKFLAINPADASGIVIKEDTVGFFLCDSQTKADRASIYCSRCHDSDYSFPTRKVTPCLCRLQHSNRKWKQVLGKKKLGGIEAEFELSEEGALNAGRTGSQSVQPYRPGTMSLSSRAQDFAPTAGLDVTGMYHCCATRTFEECHLLRATTASWRSKNLYGHIMVCLLTEPESPLLGLQSFVMPLRASSIPSGKLKTIVFVGNEEYLRQEWEKLENLPNVYYLPGSPLHRHHLRAGRLRYCASCVILGSAIHSPTDDPFLLDKEVILCALTIAAMKFRRLPSDSGIPKLFHRQFGYEIPMIAELKTDSNISYLDPDDIGLSAKHIPPSLTSAYSRGISFTSSVLDVLASTAYFDSYAIRVIRNLVSGGSTPAMDKWFAEGGRLNPHGASTLDDDDSEREMQMRKISHQKTLRLGPAELRQRTSLAQLSVLDPLLRLNNKTFTTYGDLFTHAIQRKGILCLGLYRLRYMDTGDLNMEVRKRSTTSTQSIQAGDQSAVQLTSDPLPNSESSVNSERDPAIVVDRYVITNPPNDFTLRRSDLVYCLCPFNRSKCVT